MKILVFVSLIFCLKAVSGQTITITPVYTNPLSNSVIFVARKVLALSCNVTVDGGSDSSSTPTVEWKKDGIPISQIPSLHNRFKLDNDGHNYTMKIAESNTDDVGNWSCHASVGAIEQFSNITVVTTIAVKIKTEYINVVEEEKLRIECSVLGNPFPNLSWRIQTMTYNGTDFDDRVQIKDYVDDNGKTVENGVLMIEKVNKSDRGLYYCMATNKYWPEDYQESHSMIRVKDKYAALWPFLGICVEVIVLCAIIVIYEKKRNKTELEESDTDQSPDQKNTPDHGKEANLRHRQ